MSLTGTHQKSVDIFNEIIIEWATIFGNTSQKNSTQFLGIQK